MSTPLYDQNVPENPSDTLDISQPEFLANFQAFYNIFAKNHRPIDGAGGTTPGVHTIVQLLEQSDAQQTDAGEISVYTKNAAAQTDQIFIRYQGNGQEYQYTCYQIYTLSADEPNSYFTFLPGRVIAYFGKISVPSPLVDPFFFKLQPAISTNIISISMNPTTATPLFKPVVSIQQNKKGYFNRVNVFPNSPGNPPTAPSGYFYTVLANV